jgi:poly(A) polymerase
VDVEGLRAAAAAKDKLRTLSAERIAKELLRLLEALRPGPVLRVMAATGILPELLPGALQLPRLEKLTGLEADNFLSRDAILRLAALLPNAQTARLVAQRLRLSNAERDRLEQALDGDAIAAQLSAQAARRLLYRLGAARFKDKVMLQWAGSPENAGVWRLLLEMAHGWRRPHFPLSGHDAMQAGVPQGPDVGRVLAAVEDWWVEGDFAADEGALRDRLKMAIEQA